MVLVLGIKPDLNSFNVSSDFILNRVGGGIGKIMRGSVARALRKSVGFEPDDKRDYQEIEFTVKRQIYSFLPEGDGKTTVGLVWRDVPAYLIECTSGARKIYKYLKRKWVNPSYEVQFSKLPSLADLENVANTIKEDGEFKEELKNLRPKKV